MFKKFPGESSPSLVQAGSDWSSLIDENDAARQTLCVTDRVTRSWCGALQPSFRKQVRFHDECIWSGVMGHPADVRGVYVTAPEINTNFSQLIEEPAKLRIWAPTRKTKVSHRWQAEKKVNSWNSRMRFPGRQTTPFDATDSRKTDRQKSVRASFAT